MFSDRGAKAVNAWSGPFNVLGAARALAGGRVRGWSRLPNPRVAVSVVGLDDPIANSRGNASSSADWTCPRFGKGVQFYGRDLGTNSAIPLIPGLVRPR